MSARRRLLVAAALASTAVPLLSGCVTSSAGTSSEVTSSSGASWAFSYESLDDALASTQAIVVGAVTDVEPVSDDNGNVYVTARIDSPTVIAGNIALGSLTVQQYGAESRDPGIEHLTVGSTYVLFLERFDFTSYAPCGAETGMHSVAAWGAWQQQDDGTFQWLSDSPEELPVDGYPSVLTESDVLLLSDRWGIARQNADPKDLCG